MTLVLDVISAFCLVSGAAFVLTAGIGVLRLEDVYMRMHSAGKPATLGLSLLMIGGALQLPWSGAAKLGAVLFLQLLTVSVGSHIMGRAAHRSGVRMCDHAVIDELDPVDHPGSGPLPDPR